MSLSLVSILTRSRPESDKRLQMIVLIALLTSAYKVMMLIVLLTSAYKQSSNQTLSTKSQTSPDLEWISALTLLPSFHYGLREYLPASYANVAVLTVLVYDYGKGKTCLALLDTNPRQVISLENEVCQ